MYQKTLAPINDCIKQTPTAPSTAPYGFYCSLGTIPFTVAVNRVNVALRDEGFDVLSDIDLQALIHDKLELDVRPYRILGACSPLLAHRAVCSQPDIGLLLPCNVLVREETDGSQSVGFLNPATVMQLTNDIEIAMVVSCVGARLLRVRMALLKAADSAVAVEPGMSTLPQRASFRSYGRAQGKERRAMARRV
jgi:uncharacterized protein (DUF302 family)